MLTISAGQFDALEDGSFDRFEARALHYLRQHFPESFAMAGEEWMRQAVRNGSQRAELIGLIGEDAVVRYLALQQMFGAEVDTDPAYSEIGRHLADSAVSEQERLDAAMEAGARYLDEPAASWTSAA